MIMLLAFILIGLGVALGLFGYLKLADQRIQRERIKLEMMQEETKQMKLANQIVDDFSEQKVEKRLADRKPREWTAEEIVKEVARQVREYYAMPSQIIVRHHNESGLPDFDEYWAARALQAEVEFKREMARIKEQETKVKWW